MTYSFDPVVIGAGITGLSCAYELVRRGTHPIILEPGAIGGVIRSSFKDGFTLEHGPNVFLAKESLMRIIRELGLEDRVVEPLTSKYQQFVWFKGEPTLVPKGPAALFKTPLIEGKFKLLLPFNLLRSDLASGLPAPVSVADLFSKIIGSSGVERLLNPALRGIVGGDPKELSAEAMFPKLWEALAKRRSIVSYLRSKRGGPKKRIFVLKGGMQTLPQALEQFLTSKASFKRLGVSRITRDGPGFKLGLSDASEIVTDKIFVTSSGESSARYLKDLAPELVLPLQSLKYANLTVVHLSALHSPQIPENTFGILFPTSSDTPVMGVMYNSVLFPHIAPAGKALLTVCLDRTTLGQISVNDIEQIGPIAKDALHRMLGIDCEGVLAVHTWENVIPQYRLNHPELLSKIRDAEKRIPGLYFCGAEIGGVGVPDRIEAALRSVEMSYS